MNSPRAAACAAAAVLTTLAASPVIAAAVPEKETLRVSEAASAAAAPVTVAPVELTAGPVRCRFDDGELHYLYVGDREMVRRIYFAVRDGSWNTAMPVFTKVEVHSHGANGFSIDLAADCRSDTADYSWIGHIEGASDGTITFSARGAGNRPFRSNRIGLCVLYGAPEVAGRAFETVGVHDGAAHPLTFPVHVSPDLVAPDFRTLRYVPENGVIVTTDVTGDARFDMEDQRTYSDSSFKAYAPLAYDYGQDIPPGKSLAQVVTVHVDGAEKVAAVPAEGPTTVRVGAIHENWRVPTIRQAAPDEGGTYFGMVNNQSAKFAGATELTWPYDPTVHLPDVDTLFENVLALPDQVATAHTYAPGARITLAPIRLALPGKWPARFAHDGDDPLQAAWSAALIARAAQSGVAEMRFQLGPGLGQAAQEEIAACAGRPLHDVTITGPLPRPVEAFAVDAGDGKTAVFLINTTPHVQKAFVSGIGGGTAAVTVKRINRASIAGDLPPETVSASGDGGFVLDLSPYEVARAAAP